LKFIELAVGFDKNVSGYLSEYKFSHKRLLDSEETDNFDSLFENTGDIFIIDN